MSEQSMDELLAEVNRHAIAIVSTVSKINKAYAKEKLGQKPQDSKQLFSQR